MLGAVEIIGHARRIHQAAIKIIGPAMIGADQAQSRTATRRADLGAAVAAAVVKGTQLAVPVAGD